LRRNTLVFIIAVFGLILQTVFVRPPIVMCHVAALFVMYFGLERTFVSGALMSMTLGYLSDVILGTDRGLFMFSMVMVFVIIRFVGARFQGGRGWYVTFIASLAALLTVFISSALEFTVGLGKSRFSLFSLSTVAVIITSAALGYPLYKLLKGLDERFHEPEDDFVFRE